jgi:hypothetical protein
MKKLVIVLGLLTQSAFSQMANSTNANLSIGYKTAELGFTHTLESEIILGGSFAFTDSKVIEDRTNKIDRGSSLHKLNTKYSKTVFALMGGNFKNINFIGKVGANYIDQNICKIADSRQTDGNFVKDSKVLYLAVGMEIMYQISDNIGISGSFDNVNSAMIGINYKIN